MIDRTNGHLADAINTIRVFVSNLQDAVDSTDDSRLLAVRMADELAKQLKASQERVKELEATIASMQDRVLAWKDFDPSREPG